MYVKLYDELRAVKVHRIQQDYLMTKSSSQERVFYLIVVLLMSVGMVVLDDLLNGGVEVAGT